MDVVLLVVKTRFLIKLHADLVKIILTITGNKNVDRDQKAICALPVEKSHQDMKEKHAKDAGTKRLGYMCPGIGTIQTGKNYTEN